jgi:hypothetical protein
MEDCMYGYLRAGAWAIALCAIAAIASAQDQQHEHMNMNMDEGWQFLHDGVLFGVVNHQGGARGADEFKAPNWWMGMATRKIGSSRLTLNAMVSLDPLTAGSNGYANLFQVGEALDGRPLIDRQHPHDLFMQLAAIWRTPLGEDAGFTIAGGPAGEPALGPVAFMHRASAAEYPFAPLSHHTFDSTHISYGVITAAVDRGPVVVEGSLFNGREPDERRWDFDFGRLDSVSARVWYKPSDEWEFQASTGHLTHPEELEPGNIQRTTASASWLARDGDDFNAVTVGYGVNVTDDATRHAIFGEATRHAGSVSIFGRVEALQVETNLLLTDAIPEAHEAAARKDLVAAFTIGAVKNLVDWNGLEGGVGVAATLYAVPDPLRPAYGDHPASFQIYFRLRPPAGGMGRMWNMRMSQPMSGHAME